MKTDNLALTIYLKAEQRFYKGTATKVDEVLLALWDDLEVCKNTIRELALKISLLETKDCGVVLQTTEYDALVKRLSCAKENVA